MVLQINNKEEQKDILFKPLVLVRFSHHLVFSHLKLYSDNEPIPQFYLGLIHSALPLNPTGALDSVTMYAMHPLVWECIRNIHEYRIKSALQTVL